MPYTINEVQFLDEALEEVYAINKNIFLALEPGDYLFEEYQPRTFGKAEHINILKDELLPKAKGDDEINECSMEIIQEASELQENLEEFAVAYPRAEEKCLHADELLTRFLGANLGIFPGTPEKKPEQPKAEKKRKDTLTKS